MNFKKDYINYVLHNVIHTNGKGISGFGGNPRIRNVLEKIIYTDDIVKITFLIGKTAGLEMLFKYLLYISDKIDKSQITIFNLKDNFDYDIQNLKRICETFIDIKSSRAAGNVGKQAETENGAKEIAVEGSDEKGPEPSTKIEIEHDKEILTPGEEELSEEYSEKAEENEEQGMTLIENANAGNKEEEVFELTDIEETEEKEESIKDADVSVEEEILFEETEKLIEEDVPVLDKKAEEEEITEAEQLANEIKETVKDETEIKGEEKPLPQPEKAEESIEFELEVKEPSFESEELRQMEPVKEDTVTNEAYLKFENRFFEEVKILEKLFYYVGKECKERAISKLSEKMLQSLTEIIEISGELTDITRKLSFDLTADIFFTINLFFTKAIKNPALLTGDRIILLESSLVLMNNLIKGKDYMDYDMIVEKIEKLKEELIHPVEKILDVQRKKEDIQQKPVAAEEDAGSKAAQAVSDEIVFLAGSEKQITEVSSEVSEKEVVEASWEETKSENRYEHSPADLETIVFKMKHFVKEFEKTFLSIGNITGEYSRFDALERVDDLNDSLRMIAKISATVKMNDVIKLSEVSYVFLKYLKDYRMDLMDSEIQQIIKYIIFTFKMLLTERKPEDFNVLVQYLNNPVKIFTDSN